ncbi:tyrosine/serine/threonine protein phosphatase pps1 [Arachnomyces sp. PD_36]|nr:tyrosine/serine/threonine protein phosphatase pps1 [Arachnomyces sp. PD_36]
MATTVVVQQHPVRHGSPPPPLTPALSLNSSPRSPTPVPNKYIPTCPTGPSPAQSQAPSTPPSSPPSKNNIITQTSSVLYPPDHFPSVSHNPPIYSIDAHTLVSALDQLATQPLPDPKLVFPWLHGLHPDNHMQLAFFVTRRRSQRRTPKCFRAITIVKVGGDLGTARLKGAIAPEEILSPTGSGFLEPDPPEGFSVRNFQIQASKLASLSDIIVYGEDGAHPEDVMELAENIAMAQKDWRKRFDNGFESPIFNTFVLSSSFKEIENDYPDIVAVGSRGELTGHVMDFFQWERLEMCNMSKASEISHNVWQGPTPDPATLYDHEELLFDVYIEASDIANIPSMRQLRAIGARVDEGPQRLEFPSSGSVMPPSWSQNDIRDFIETCRWIYKLAHPEGTGQLVDADGDTSMTSHKAKSRRILIHCGDGYTESSLLAVGYFMFAEGVPVHEAWLKLHCEKQRNFFAYSSDVNFLMGIQQQILEESPATGGRNVSRIPDPAWLSRMDGSLPSRILPYMYLGNLPHANNPELLRALGITRILSVGEPVSWHPSTLEQWGEDNLLLIDQVQDNGIDPLTGEFDRCLEFIAEVMASLGLSFPRAYCFVRARRLNVIIQPHLRFVYELLKWEELQQKKRNEPLRRELEWATIAREIALMNKPYSRQ